MDFLSDDPERNARYQKAKRDGDDTASDPETDRKQKLAEFFLDCWTLVNEADKNQRARELDDLKFDRAFVEDHWPEDSRRMRQADEARGIAARPCLVINKLDQPIQQVINEARQARLGIRIKPKGGNASKDGANLRQGMIRAIEQDSNAQAARMAALERAVKCGRGFYRIVTDYANDGDFDQDILIKAIENQGSVYEDPFSVEPDGSDVEWTIITGMVSKASFLRDYGKSKLANYLRTKTERTLTGGSSSDELTSETDVNVEWVTDEGIRLAEMYRVDRVMKTLVFNPQDGDKVLLEPGEEVPKGPGIRTREVPVRVIKHSVHCGSELLKESDWPGRFIPIIRVTGKKYVVDGKDRVFKGMIFNAKDAQRSYNYMRSSQVELVALSTRAPWLLDPKQIHGYEAEWAEANVRNKPYLPYHQFDAETEKEYGPPIRNVWEAPLEGITLLAREAEADVKSTTGRFDPSLGQMSSERSGRAIRELKQQGENSSSHYLENLASHSMPYEARQLLDLLPKIYDREGRIVRLLGDDPRDEKHAILGVPFIPNPDGMPQPVQQQAPPGMLARMMGGARRMMGGQPQAEPPQPITYNLNDGGEYMCQVSVGRADATQREANIELMTTLLETTKGAVAPAIIDIYAEQMEGPLADRLAKRLRSMNPNLNDEGDVSGIPPAIQAQMQQMQMQMQQMGQALQQAQQQIATDAYKVDAEVSMAQAKLANDRQIAMDEIRAKVAIEKAKLTSEEAIKALEAEQEMLANEAKAAAAAALENLKALNKRREIAMQHTLGAVFAPPEPTGSSSEKDGDKKEKGGNRVLHSAPHPAAGQMLREFIRPPRDVGVGPSGDAHDPRSNP